MQIILLSGGSGKRLWPLSNDTRSKQFLQLLQDPNGQRESMVQRVVRQITESEISNNITIATSEAQRDSITNQLNTAKINLVTEPCRRDTFPAIALSSAYLALEKGCSREEVIVVMPSDTYTDSGYFETIRSMSSLVDHQVADLVLMGIAPTTPSTKFGYVIANPTESGIYYQVERFTEKPDKVNAQLLFNRGAFWNGGVFAFKLGYMMDIIHQYIQTDSFAELRSRYEELPKISFDYEVAEKATSVALIPFSGQWEDLGTWNALIEELPHTTLGNVVRGDNTSGTTIINELNTPIVCDGTKDLIVAASYDGILICGRESSELIKKYIEPIDARPMYEERRWGTYAVINHAVYSDGYRSLTKELLIKAGRNISYQVHHHRDEVWTFVDGEGLLVLDDVVTHVSRGSVIDIKKGQKHAVKALTDLRFIEVQAGDKLTEDDIDRFEWTWEE